MIDNILYFLNANSAAITALSVLGAGTAWVLKLPYDKYRKEIVAISKLERLFALNEVSMKDNIEFMKMWQEAISSSRPYSCHFEPLIIEDISNLHISDLKLVNKLLKINYMMKRSDDDLKNLYKGYWEVIPQINNISDLKLREKNLEEYHKNILSALESITEGAVIVYKKIIPILAHIQVAGSVRSNSIFGYAQSILLFDVFPRTTNRKISLKMKFLETEKAKSSLD